MDGAPGQRGGSCLRAQDGGAVIADDGGGEVEGEQRVCTEEEVEETLPQPTAVPRMSPTPEPLEVRTAVTLKSWTQRLLFFARHSSLRRAAGARAWT